MNISEIPLTPNNQQFNITLVGVLYKMRVIWRDPFWCLDISDSRSVPIINGIPLITGADLLAQYAYLNFNFGLIVLCDVDGQVNPTKTDLGRRSHLYVVTE
ncbi:phage baseplate plug family protein [Leminorella grimontii]|uniref:phage baseplate plug family protein n=1 Tax=Leminorella grimontii TaxID=82981 RepID=UPI00321FC23F